MPAAESESKTTATSVSGSPVAGPELYFIGVPLGNPGDITLRALEIFRKADYIVCEDRRTASTLFKRLNVKFPEDWDTLNEHTRDSELGDIISKIKKYKISVVISDAGMPILCDPGADLLEMARKQDIRIHVIPGPSALILGLTLSGLGGDGFVFMGLPPRKTPEREIFLGKIVHQRLPVVLYETPYRLKKLLLELYGILPENKKVFVCVALTTENEFYMECPARDLGKRIREVPEGPPVVIVADS